MKILHYGSLLLTIAGVVMMIADKAHTIPGDIGYYCGVVAVLLGAVLHAFNSPSVKQ